MPKECIKRLWFMIKRLKTPTSTLSLLLSFVLCSCGKTNNDHVQIMAENIDIQVRYDGENFNIISD
jgi:hypothetical protein